MKDGHTRKLVRSQTERSLFLDRNGVSLVVLAGPAAGSEHELERESVSVGRGPGVDIAFGDAAMSREHAVFELLAEGYRVRDLGSTNGLCVNGARVLAADLKHGDRIELGEHVLQYVVCGRERVGRYDLSEGD